jgi:putative ABC transport system ATP-binding protein
MAAEVGETGEAIGREAPLIAIDGVSKQYASAAGVVHALRDVNLYIQRGEFVAIVGTSGSGKSTLMNILGCLDRPTEGSYLLYGIDVGARTSDGRALVRNRLIGFIFQGFNLLPRTSALENVELPLSYRGVATSVRRERAEAALRSVGLGDRMDHAPNQLSGGQQQRVAIARALVTDPPLLLADEPTGNLDTRTSLEVLALLQNLNRTSGITICLVTHEPDIAACASRVVTFRDGRILSDVHNDAPTDAAHELVQLGANPLASVASTLTEQQQGAHEGPVPKRVYAAMFLGTLVGALVGIAYNKMVLALNVAWVVALAAVLVEGLFGARAFRKHVGPRMSVEQRIRVSLTYTLGFAVLVGAVLVAWMPAWLVAGTTSRGLVSVAATTLAVILASTAARIASLSVFFGRRTQ